MEVDQGWRSSHRWHGRGFVRGEVIEDKVDVEGGLHTRVELTQKRDEVLGRMLGLVTA
jgi:hypothetical protein